MATKTINTRIKNRVDILSNWQQSGVELLPGEIALVKVTTQQIDATTGNVVNVPAVLMKVGEEGKTFNELPWLSAKAADVYDWAKTQYSKDIAVDVITGNQNGEDVVTQKTLGTWLKELYNSQSASDADFAELNAKVDVEKVSTAITEAINTLDSTSVGSAGDGKFVKSVVQTDGKVVVTYGDITENDLPDISASKIIVTPASGTLGEENYVPAVTVSDKFDDISAEIAGLQSAVAGGVHFVGIVTSPADLIESSNAVNIKIQTSEGEKDYTAINGDVVIQGDKEFIWVASESSWKELGDLSRVGTIEAQIAAMDFTDSEESYKVVTAVNQTDGKIAVTKKELTANEIKYGEASTVGAELSALESSAIRLNSDNKLYVGDDTATTIIFDCGGAVISEY